MRRQKVAIRRVALKDALGCAVVGWSSIGKGMALHGIVLQRGWVLCREPMMTLMKEKKARKPLRKKNTKAIATWLADNRVRTPCPRSVPGSSRGEVKRGTMASPTPIYTLCFPNGSSRSEICALLTSITKMSFPLSTVPLAWLVPLSLAGPAETCRKEDGGKAEGEEEKRNIKKEKQTLS